MWFISECQVGCVPVFNYGLKQINFIEERTEMIVVCVDGWWLVTVDDGCWSVMVDDCALRFTNAPYKINFIGERTEIIVVCIDDWWLRATFQ